MEMWMEPGWCGWCVSSIYESCVHVMCLQWWCLCEKGFFSPIVLTWTAAGLKWQAHRTGDVREKTERVLGLLIKHMVTGTASTETCVLDGLVTPPRHTQRHWVNSLPWRCSHTRSHTRSVFTHTHSWGLSAVLIHHKAWLGLEGIDSASLSSCGDNSKTSLHWRLYYENLRHHRRETTGSVFRNWSVFLVYAIYINCKDKSACDRSSLLHW